MQLKNTITLISTTVVFIVLTASIHAQQIFEAVNHNDLEKVKVLLTKDISLVNIKDEAGNTPLHQAAITGSTEIIGFLLSEGADINAQNTRLYTPLHEAIENRKEDCSILLIKKGADLAKANIFEQTPLHKAASVNQKRTGKLLISKGASIDPVDRWQRTPFLVVARITGDVDFGKLLLDKGANINAKDSHNLMALNLAAWKGFNDFIDLLLDHGAEYYSSPRESSWMLSHAAQCGSVRLFKIVLKREKELLSNESFKMQIMDTAIQGGSVEIVNLLLSKNIPFNRDANMYGWTPAHYAARNGQADMIRFLQENDFNLDQRTLSGKSVYNIAHEYDQVDVMRAIKQMKGDTGPARFPELSGAYLGQTPPRGNLRLFAPDIVSGAIGDDNHGSISFMPEGNEVYWNMWLNGKGKIWMTKLQNDQWIKPEIASFSDEGSATDDNPFITPDGRKLFFTSTRSGSVSEGKENIWFVERTSSGWSDPKPVSDEVNAMQLHWSVSVSNSGTLYFGGSGADSYGGTDIYYSRLKEGVYTRPENIGSVINSEGTDHCPYIAPDESYIIFSRFGTGAGFYISYKNPSGKWLEPAKVHARLEGVCPCISPNGRYFFFNMDGIYWMPAGFIERLKPVTGPYLGQEPPGMVPKPFIPGLLNNEKTGAFCSVYSPALDEFYFTRWHREDGTPSGIAWMRMVDGEWSRPEMLGFNSSDSENDMCLSKDGNTMIFRSWRPLPDGTRPDNHSYLWYVTRTESGWSDALPLLCGNEPVRTGYPSASRNNTLYFSHRRDGLLGVYRSELVNGEYQTPEHVTTLFSQNYIHGDLFVAPDESYLIVSGRDPEGKIGFGKNLDLNILYKKVDGSWSRPINMGKDINTIAGGENCPQVSPDGKYLFFNRYNPELKKGNTHWISSHIIERYKHK